MGKYNIERISQQIRIGWDGENNWRPQTFDCSSLLATRPNGTVTLWILPNGESEAFPVALTADGNLRTWTPLDSELVGGGGKLQFHCQSGTDVGKSPVYRYVVEGSLLTGAEHPDDTPSWAVQVVEDVTEAAGHYPYIGENGNWFVWDTTEGEFVDTGVSAGGGDISPEDIAEAVEDYMDEHPVTETDPTVPAWAKQPSKPTYTAQEVGAMPSSYVAPVQSVNGKTGVVVLDAEDVGALPDDTPIPAAVTEQTVAGWGFTKNTGTYSKPSGGIPKTDLASDVQTSLGRADTALQQHQSLAGYATESYVQQQIAAIPAELPTVSATDNGKFLRVVNGAWAAQAESFQTQAITDMGGYYTTDTVEGALQEIGAELAGINTLIGTGVIT